VEYCETLKPGGFSFFYDDTLFRPGTDSFLLSAFPALKPGLQVCDLGSGTGLLGLLLLQRQPDLHITGIERLPEAVRLAEKTAVYNELEHRLQTISGDYRQIRSLLPANQFDLVICNPPYYASGTGHPAATPQRQSARSEQYGTLDDICRAAAFLLRWSGSFCLVHKPERLTDLLCAMREHHLEPKRIRPVCKLSQLAPSLILVEGRRGGNPGLTWLPPLVLQLPDGSPSPEMNAIYFR